MGSTALISMEAYLSRSFQPDCEYVDGRIRQRNLGERDHSKLQMAIAAYLYARRRELGIHVYPEQRVQVSASRFRIPDVCVVAGRKPSEMVLTSAPFICIEILSKDDTMQEVQERIDDYLEFGVPNVWILNPRSRKAYVYTSAGSQEAKDGYLRTTSPRIEVPLDVIFSELD